MSYYGMGQFWWPQICDMHDLLPYYLLIVKLFTWTNDEHYGSHQNQMFSVVSIYKNLS